MQAFASLIFQAIRQSPVMYGIGITGIVAGWGSIVFFFAVMLARKGIHTTSAWVFFVGLVIAALCAMAVFPGLIFYKDQKVPTHETWNESGVSVNKFWWSRIIPASAVCFLLAIPVVLLTYFPFWWGLSSAEQETAAAVFVFASLLFIPAIGSICSFSLRYAVLSVIASAFGLFVLLILTFSAVIYFGATPFWTTLPLALALFAGSRMQAGYWFCGQLTWKTKLLSWVPFFVTLLLITAAIPLVRIYSVPYVSWDDVEKYFDAADIPERMPPEKRKALMQYARSRSGTPPAGYVWEGNMPPHEEKGATRKERILQVARYHLGMYKRNAAGVPTLEEYLLRHSGILDAYNEELYRQRNSGGESLTSRYYEFVRHLPWERKRRERLATYSIVVGLVKTGRLPQSHAIPRNWYLEPERKHVYSLLYYQPLSGDFVLSMSNLFAETVCKERRSLVHAALWVWYLEHDNTLPENIDALVGKYLDAVPVHPLTQQPAEFRNGVITLGKEPMKVEFRPLFQNDGK